MCQTGGVVRSPDFVYRVLLDLHQARNDIEIRSIRNLKLLPVLRRIGIGATPDMNLDCLSAEFWILTVLT